MPVNFINMTEAEFLQTRLIYKNMPLENALLSLKEKYVWFANPVEWTDPFEKKFIKGNYKVKGTEHCYPWFSQIFCACFTQASTSEAYWNIYSQKQIGVTLKFNRQKLLEALSKSNHDVYIGPVQYEKTNIINSPLSLIPFLKDCIPLNLNNKLLRAKLILLKRKSYEYEKEIRIIIIKKNKTQEKGIKLPFQMEPNEIIDSITIDPHVGSCMEEFIKSIFQNTYGFAKLKIQKSYLYDEDRCSKIISL